MKKVPTVLFILLFSGLVGCTFDCPAPAPGPTQVVDTACQWATPIQVGASDTVETKRAALAAWKTWNANCGKLQATPFK